MRTAVSEPFTPVNDAVPDGVGPAQLGAERPCERLVVDARPQRRDLLLGEGLVFSVEEAQLQAARPGVDDQYAQALHLRGL